MPFVYSIKCKLEREIPENFGRSGAPPYREYIGQTVQDDFQIRLNGHISDVNNGRKRHLYNAIRLHGWDQFSIEILHSFPREGDWQERLDDLEIQEIAQRGTLSPGGYNNETGGNKNKVLHEDTKALMSSVRSGDRHAMFGKHHDAEARELIRLANLKSVQQWSKDGTQLLRTFESVEEATKTSGADGSHISKVCKGERKTAGGFHWKFVNPEDIQTNEPLKFEKIQQWSFDAKTLIAEYDSLDEATQVTNSGTRTISKCCKGKLRSAGGFKWKSV
jgi:group I intron endonuclease